MWKRECCRTRLILRRSLARFYATVLRGLSVQAVDGATRAELDTVVLAALRAWPA